MRLNRRQLRRLIESAIYEQAEGGKKKVVPKEVRVELRTLNAHGFTCLAFDQEGNRGLSILIPESDEKEQELIFNRLKKTYGAKVKKGVTAKLQGGSAAIKSISDGERFDAEGIKTYFEDAFADGSDIFIEID